jgi:hypothetical protein
VVFEGDCPELICNEAGCGYETGCNYTRVAVDYTVTNHGTVPLAGHGSPGSSVQWRNHLEVRRRPADEATCTAACTSAYLSRATESPPQFLGAFGGQEMGPGTQNKVPLQARN